MTPEESRAADGETQGGRLGSQAAHERDSLKKAQWLNRAAQTFHAAASSRNKSGEALENDATSNSEAAAGKRSDAKGERDAAASAPDKAERNKHNHKADDIDLEAENVSKTAWELFDQAAYQYQLAAGDFETESRLHHEASRTDSDRQKAAREEDGSVVVLLDAANSRRKSAEMYRRAANEPGNPDCKTKHSQASEQFNTAAKDRQRSIDSPKSIGGLGEKSKQQSLQKQDQANADDESRKVR